MTDRTDALAPLRQIALRFPSGVTSETALPRVGVVRHDAPTEPMSGVFRPMMCMVLQGAKEASIGGKTVHYDEACYLVATMELAGRGRVIRASLERPYLCVALSIDLEGLASLLPAVPVKEEGQQPAFAVNPVTDDLIAAWGRLLGLLDTPEDIPVLAPLIEREILYRLLQGPQGAVLRQAAFAGSHHAQVRRAMLWLKEHYAEPMRIDDLAEMAGMSPASFHRHFKAAAAMSPLQYQKALRLQEARRLLASNADAARTAFAVGYESPSQFSREYARAFGLPPARDAQRLKGVRMEDAV